MAMAKILSEIRERRKGSEIRKRIAKMRLEGKYKGNEIRKMENGMRVKGERTNRSQRLQCDFFSFKGQMFLIASILIIIALIALKNLFGIYATAEEKRFGESSQLDKELRNVKNEYRYILEVAALQNDANASGIDYLYNFSNLLRNDNAKTLYLFVFNNGSNQRFSATVGNFLNDKINVTLNATNADSLGFNFVVNDKKNVTKIFQASINGTVNLTLKYERQENTTEEFKITTNKNQVFGFFDIQLEDSRLFLRSKDVYNWSWI